jgi:hypothetical protein
MIRFNFITYKQSLQETHKVGLLKAQFTTLIDAGAVNYIHIVKNRTPNPIFSACSLNIHLYRAVLFLAAWAEIAN